MTGGAPAPDPAATADPAPVTPAAFAGLMARFDPPVDQALVGVSGGADSMALSLLMADWAAATGARLRAVTVDHRLRAGSTAEADRVRRWLTARGIQHRVLAWQDRPASADVGQAAARAARLDLLCADAARTPGTALVLAHTAEDQAETVLLRLAKASGVDGLAGIAADTTRMAPDGTPVRLLRPLLGIEKARLIATCQAAGQAWMDDPTNRNTRFARARLRAAKAALDREGLTVPGLVRVAERMADARAALEAVTAAALAEACAVSPFGAVTLGFGALRAHPREIRLRALDACLRAAGGGTWPADRSALADLDRRLAAGQTVRATLAGCALVTVGDWCVRIVREARGLPAPVRADGHSGVLDGRFRLTGGAGADPDVMLAPLGSGHRRRVGLEAIPDQVARTLPCLWRDDSPVAVPATGGDPAGRDGWHMAFIARGPLGPALCGSVRGLASAPVGNIY